MADGGSGARSGADVNDANAAPRGQLDEREIAIALKIADWVKAECRKQNTRPPDGPFRCVLAAAMALYQGQTETTL